MASNSMILKQTRDLIESLNAEKAKWLATDPQQAPAGRAANLRRLNRQLRQLRDIENRYTTAEDPPEKLAESNGLHSQTFATL